MPKLLGHRALDQALFLIGELALLMATSTARSSCMLRRVTRHLHRSSRKPI
jgi:hypothetical protein